MATSEEAKAAAEAAKAEKAAADKAAKEAAKAEKAEKAEPVRTVTVRRGDGKKVHFRSDAHENPEQAARVYANAVKGEIINL